MTTVTYVTSSAADRCSCRLKCGFEPIPYSKEGLFRKRQTSNDKAGVVKIEYVIIKALKIQHT